MFGFTLSRLNVVKTCSFAGVKNTDCVFFLNVKMFRSCFCFWNTQRWSR